jgi:hypothetical protein
MQPINNTIPASYHTEISYNDGLVDTMNLSTMNGYMATIEHTDNDTDSIPDLVDISDDEDDDDDMYTTDRVIIANITSVEDNKGKYDDFTFIIENGCVGGNLITTKGAQDMLQNLQHVRNCYIKGATGTVQATMRGDLPLAGETFYAPIETANLISLKSLQDRGIKHRQSKDDNKLVLFKADTGEIMFECKQNNNGHFTITLRDLVELEKRYLHMYTTNTTTTTAHKRYNQLPTHLSANELHRAREALELHRTTGHMSDDSLSTALDNGCYTNINLTSQDIRNMRKVYGPCTACYEGKATMPQDLAASHSILIERIGQLIHIDLKQYKTETIGGNTWSMIAMDDKSSYISVIGMKSKTTKSITDAIKQIILFYNQHGHKVEAFMMDPERTLLSAKDFLSSVGVRMHDIIPGLHERKLERTIRTIVERERTLKADLPYELPSTLDGELRYHITDILNATPNTNTINRTPSELVTHNKPSVKDYAFGQPGLFYHSSPKTDSSQSNADYGIITGFNKDARNKYRVYVPFMKAMLSRGSFQPLSSIPPEWGWPLRLRQQPPRVRVHINQAAPAAIGEVFHIPTNSFIQSGTPVQGHTEVTTDHGAPAIAGSTPIRQIEEGTSMQQPQTSINNNATAINQPQSITPTPTPIPAPEQIPAITPVDTLSHTDTEHIQQTVSVPPVRRQRVAKVIVPSQPVVTRSGRIVRPSVRTQSLHTNIYTLAMKVYQHAYKTSITKALNSEHSKESHAAIKNEIDYMIKYKVMVPEMFEDIPYHHRSNMIRSHMFLKWKYHPDGRFDKIKARLVGGGDMQSIYTYDETNSPTINSITVMALLNIMTVLQLEHTVADINGAYLSAEVKENDPTIYLIIPRDVTDIWISIYPEYRKYVRNDGCMCMRLLKYIYGLKQAARKFNEKLHDKFIRYGLIQSISDQCLYYKESDEYLLIVAIHVDDLLILARRLKPSIEDFINYLEQEWDLNTQYNNEFSYLGLSIIRDRVNNTTTISQYKYLQDILNKWSNYNHNTQRYIPMDISYTTRINDTDTQCDKHNFLSIVMSLMYLARYTRPDILFAITYLATKCDTPTHNDMKAAYNVINYLRNTGNYAYQFSGDTIKLSVYIDASHGLHKDTKGHTAIVITLGTAPIMTRSAKQKIVALHSTDAEMIAVCDGLTYVIWLRLLLSELLFEVDQPIPIYQDNKSAILLYNGGGQFKRSKHMYVKQQYVKDLITHKIIDIVYLSGLEIPADPITKPVPAIQLQRMLNMLHIIKA